MMLPWSPRCSTGACWEGDGVGSFTQCTRSCQNSCGWAAFARRARSRRVDFPELEFLVRMHVRLWAQVVAGACARELPELAKLMRRAHSDFSPPGIMIWLRELGTRSRRFAVSSPLLFLWAVESSIRFTQANHVGVTNVVSKGLLRRQFPRLPLDKVKWMK